MDSFTVRLDYSYNYEPSVAVLTENETPLRKKTQEKVMMGGDHGPWSRVSSSITRDDGPWLTGRDHGRRKESPVMTARDWQAVITAVKKRHLWWRPVIDRPWSRAVKKRHLWWRQWLTGRDHGRQIASPVMTARDWQAVITGVKSSLLLVITTDITASVYAARWCMKKQGRRSN